MLKNKKANIFRESALAKIRSPEQLDALLPITSPMSWLMLATIGFALAVIVWWSIFGTILRTTDGQGIIIRDMSFGIMDVSGVGSGAVVEILTEPGKAIEVGQVLMRLDYSMKSGRIENSRKALQSMVEQAATQQVEEDARLKILLEKQSNQQSLFNRGLITKTPLLETQNAISELQTRSFNRRQQILEQEIRIREMNFQQEQEEEIIATHRGRVIEVLVDIGDFVQPGQPIVRLESLTGDYEAKVYVPAAEGKRIQPGMPIRISPSIVRPEEYGFILGRVTAVSTFPASRENLIRSLRNESLAASLTQSGPALAVSVEMERDPDTPSGYRWSSSNGPPYTIESGTICSASVVLRHQSPITLLIPFIRRQLGIID